MDRAAGRQIPGRKGMKYILAALAAAAGLWVVFILIPATVVFIAVFGRKGCRPYSPGHMTEAYYAPYAEKTKKALEKLRSIPFSELTCRADDGVLLTGRLWGPPGKTVILAHGFRSIPDNPLAVQAVFFAERGWSVLLPDERAHGGSGGRFCTMGILESGDLCRWSELLRTEHGAERIAVYGLSMGAAATAYASDRIAADRIVLDCPFESPAGQMTRLCRKKKLPAFLLIPASKLISRLLCRADFGRRTEDTLSKTKIPALFICGTADSTVPPAGVRAMSDACPTSAGCVLVEGAEHSVAFPAGGDELADRVERFISGTDR